MHGLMAENDAIVGDRACCCEQLPVVLRDQQGNKQPHLCLGALPPLPALCPVVLKLVLFCVGGGRATASIVVWCAKPSQLCSPDRISRRCRAT